jgi:hypothetical protein
LRPKFQALLILTGFILLLFSCDRADPTHDPLPSWHEGPRKMRIISFVATISDPGNDAYVKPSARIAVFDNDGTLWAEKPIYVQLAFALARIREIAPQHPQWQREEPFAAVLNGDLETVMAGGEAALGKIIAASHSGMTARRVQRCCQPLVGRGEAPRDGSALHRNGLSTHARADSLFAGK